MFKIVYWHHKGKTPSCAQQISMSDNLIIRTSSGNATVATDEIAGVHVSRVKLISGVDGVNDGDVSTVNPLPVRSIQTSNLAGITVATNSTTAVRADVILKYHDGTYGYTNFTIVDTDGTVTLASKLSSPANVSGVTIWSLAKAALTSFTFTIVLNANNSKTLTISSGQSAFRYQDCLSYGMSQQEIKDAFSQLNSYASTVYYLEYSVTSATVNLHTILSTKRKSYSWSGLTIYAPVDIKVTNLSVSESVFATFLNATASFTNAVVTIGPKSSQVISVPASSNYYFISSGATAANSLFEVL